MKRFTLWWQGRVRTCWPRAKHCRQTRHCCPSSKSRDPDLTLMAGRQPKTFSGRGSAATGVMLRTEMGNTEQKYSMKNCIVSKQQEIYLWYHTQEILSEFLFNKDEKDALDITCLWFAGLAVAPFVSSLTCSVTSRHFSLLLCLELRVFRCVYLSASNSGCFTLRSLLHQLVWP